MFAQHICITVETGQVKAWLTLEAPVVCLTRYCAGCARAVRVIVVIVKTQIHNKYTAQVSLRLSPPAILFVMTRCNKIFDLPLISITPFSQTTCSSQNDS